MINWIIVISGALAIAGTVLDCNCLTIICVVIDVISGLINAKGNKKIANRIKGYNNAFQTEESPDGSLNMTFDGGTY